MIYPVVIYGHPVLRKVAEDLTPDQEGLSQIVDNLFETMYSSDGIGFAAPQAGFSKRLFVIDADPMKDEFPECTNFKKVFYNAHILERDGDTVSDYEGCLSLPGIREEVARPSRIRIQYLDQDWKAHDEVYEGWAARVIQHEYDHLDGILFVDHLSGLRKRLLKGKLNAISRGRVNVNYRIKLAK